MADRIVTSELRWFHDGEPPREMAEWLASDEVSPEQPQQRGVEDQYLWTGRDDMSLKLRGSELELKRLTGRRRIAHEGVEGWLESWEKRGRAKEPTDDVRGLITIVHKRRRSLLFALRDDKVVPLGDPDGTPPGVVELASLAVPGHRAWTLCLEANEGHEQLLEPMLGRLASSLPPTWRRRLTTASSMGYPRWLLDHAKRPRMSDERARAALPSLAT